MPENSVFLFPGLAWGKALVHLYTGLGRFKGLTLSVPSIKWLKFRVLLTSKTLLYIYGITLVHSEFSRLIFF